jgi:hypothetical protein
VVVALVDLKDFLVGGRRCARCGPAARRQQVQSLLAEPGARPPPHPGHEPQGQVHELKRQAGHEPCHRRGQQDDRDDRTDDLLAELLDDPADVRPGHQQQHDHHEQRDQAGNEGENLGLHLHAAAAHDPCGEPALARECD